MVMVYCVHCSSKLYWETYCLDIDGVFHSSIALGGIGWKPPSKFWTAILKEYESRHELAAARGGAFGNNTCHKATVDLQALSQVSINMCVVNLNYTGYNDNTMVVVVVVCIVNFGNSRVCRVWLLVVVVVLNIILATRWHLHTSWPSWHTHTHTHTRSFMVSLWWVDMNWRARCTAVFT